MLKVKSTFLTIWSILDPIYYSFTRLVCIEHKANKNVFRVRLTRYRGPELVLSDGTVIKKNDILLKIHLHNIILLKDLMPISNNLIKGRRIYRLVEQSMPGLAEFIMNHPKYHQIKGIVGITTLNRGCKELGFEIFSIQNNVYKLYKWVTLLPLHLLTTAHPMKKSNKHVPTYLMMSKPSLLHKYGA
jgi:hypothetical protein